MLAQAIIESNWGKSRFAIEGNNYFGIRTWDDNVPQLKPLKDQMPPLDYKFIKMLVNQLNII